MEGHKKAKFGVILGYAPGNVPVYSCNHDPSDPEPLPNRQDYRSTIGEIFLGYKWQCVEFARRWLYCNKGYVFDDIAMAYDIFQLRSVLEIETKQRLPLQSFKNGAKRPPEPGCLLIWDEGGQFEVTGHVAIVTEVFHDKVRIVEQNMDNSIWPPGQSYSRELKAIADEEGCFWIESQFFDAKILGWVIQTSDEAHAETIKLLDKRLFNLKIREMKHEGQSEIPWLNVANPDEKVFVDMMHGHHHVTDAQGQYKYFCISKTAECELRRATNELHLMIMHAINFVLRDDSLLEKFCIPQNLWPKLHTSWDNRKNEMITGRFDFVIREEGLKLYEYNCDSASCHMECGKIQIKWAEHYNCHDGESTGEDLHHLLVEAWQDKKITEPLHILYDDNLEETYHAYFMKSAIEQANISCKMVKNFSGFSCNAAGDIIDQDGLKVKYVWKTWAWESALDQIRLDPSETIPELTAVNDSVKLADILLKKSVRVYEPFWTLIPSNKAILPILWMLYPNNPYLLNSQFELTDALRQKGYVIKPIVGRRGHNIKMYDKHNHLLSTTDGKFAGRHLIYQELFCLPKIQDHYVQANTFTVNGYYAGSSIRADRSLIITGENDDLYPLRVIYDEEYDDD